MDDITSRRERLATLKPGWRTNGSLPLRHIKRTVTLAEAPEQVKRPRLGRRHRAPIAWYMSVTLDVVHEHRRVHLRIDGFVSCDEIVQLLPELREDPLGQYTVLWDARNALPYFEWGDLARIRDALRLLDGGTPKATCIAIVATDEAIRSFASAVASYIRAAGYRVGVFLTIEDAVAWLESCGSRAVIGA